MQGLVLSAGINTCEFGIMCGCDRRELSAV